MISHAKWAELEARYSFHWSKSEKTYLPGNPVAPRWLFYEERDNLDLDLPDDRKFADRPTHLGGHVMGSRSFFFSRRWLSRLTLFLRFPDHMVTVSQEAIKATDDFFRKKTAGWKTSLDEDLSGTWTSWWEQAVATKDRALDRDLRRMSSHVNVCPPSLSYHLLPCLRALLTPWVTHARQSIYKKYTDSRREAARAKDSTSTTRADPPGSPSKRSPGKGKEWKYSSLAQKEALVALNASFWSILDGAPFESKTLSGPLQVGNVRSLLVWISRIQLLFFFSWN